MASVNKVMLIGNLGQDPDVRSTQDGLTIANLSVATSNQWKHKTTGEKKEETEWHRVVLYGNAADFAKTYLKKGAKVYIDGRLRTRKWTDEKGVERYTTEIVSMTIQSLDKAPTSSNRPPEPPMDDDPPF